MPTKSNKWLLPTVLWFCYSHLEFAQQIEEFAEEFGPLLSVDPAVYVNLGKNLYNSAEEMYELASALAAGDISAGDLLRILGEGAKEALVGDILYIKDNAALFLPDAQLTEAQAKELGSRTAGAIFQLGTIGFTASGLVKAAKTFTAAKVAGAVGAGKVTINSLDDFFVTPKKFGDATPNQYYKYFQENGYNPQPLGSKSSLKGVPFEQGGGFRINWGGDRYLQYHPSTSSHHGNAYWKISSGSTGALRFDLKGNLLP